MDEYIERLKKAYSICDMNDILEEAAHDDRLTNDEYQSVYREALSIVNSPFLFARHV